jgi:manganese transport protein
VILAANLMAMLVQSMSAKLGIATGKNLPEVCKERFPKPFSLFLWIQAEVMAIATDLAEFIGAALGLNLLFGIPLFPAGLITGVGVLASLLCIAMACAFWRGSSLPWLELCSSALLFKLLFRA